MTSTTGSFESARTDGAEFVTAQVTRVGENFLETIGAPLLRGRTITLEDRIMAAPVAVISEPLAKQLFPATEPIGERVTVTLEESREQEFTIVGVSADFATSQLTTERPQILLPLPEALAPTVHLIARGAPGDEPKLKAALETALRELGVEALPGVAFAGIVTGQDLVEKSLGDLISESIARGIRRRCCADSGGARNRRRRGVHGGHANTRNRRSDGAGVHASTRVRPDAVGHREAGDPRRRRRPRSLRRF